jgi:hypothetical protein
MGGRRLGDIPAELVRGRDRFEAWRETRVAGTRIPARLWKLAVKLAGRHGLNRTASVLRLDYYSLKKRLEAAEEGCTGRVAADPPTSNFVELPSSSLRSPSECIIEFEDGAGASMRVHLTGGNVPDLLALARSFWGDE